MTLHMFLDSETQSILGHGTFNTYGTLLENTSSQ